MSLKGGRGEGKRGIGGGKGGVVGEKGGRGGHIFLLALFGIFLKPENCTYSERGGVVKTLVDMFAVLFFK